MTNVTTRDPHEHEFEGLWNAIARARVEELTANSGYRVTLPNGPVFFRRGAATAWNVSEHHQVSLTRLAGSCANLQCPALWLSADSALDSRIEQHEQAMPAVSALLRIYRSIGAYMPPSVVTWWLRQGDWLIWSETVRATAEEACLIAAERAAGWRFRTLAHDEIVVLDTAEDDTYLPTAVGAQLQEAALQVPTFQRAA